MLKPALALVAACAMAGCTLPPSPPGASLPFDAVAGAGDPMRSAASNTSAAFASPGRLAGQPFQAAQAVAQMEFLAAEMPNNPRFFGINPSMGQQMALARQEWRAALGIPADLPPQTVIDSLYAASRALRTGQPAAAAAALPTAVFPQGGETALVRLASLPNLPLTNQAAVGVTDVFRRHDGQGRGRF